MDKLALTVGVQLKEVVTHDAIYGNCRVLHADGVGLVFEVQRTISGAEGIERVVSQLLVPWGNIRHVVLVEERA
jgi:hypothetical protein